MASIELCKGNTEKADQIRSLAAVCVHWLKRGISKKARRSIGFGRHKGRSGLAKSYRQILRNIHTHRNWGIIVFMLKAH